MLFAHKDSKKIDNAERNRRKSNKWATIFCIFMYQRHLSLVSFLDSYL